MTKGIGSMCRIPLLLALLALAACTYGTQVFFKYPPTGQVIAVCGPYPREDTAAQDQETCFKKAAAMGLVQLQQ